MRRNHARLKPISLNTTAPFANPQNGPQTRTAAKTTVRAALITKRNSVKLGMSQNLGMVKIWHPTDKLCMGKSGGVSPETRKQDRSWSNDDRNWQLSEETH